MGLSVVIPTKDRRHLLTRVLPSYFAQPEMTQLVIVVDGSTDGTAEYLTRLARREPRLTVLVNEVNLGVPAAKNRALAAVSEDLVFIAEDDLELTDDFLATLLAHREALGADLMSGRVVWRHDGESARDAIARTDAVPGPMVDRAAIEIRGGVVPADDAFTLMTASPILGRSDVVRGIGFDPGYRVNFWREETDFQVTAQERGYTLAICPHAVCFNYIVPGDRGGCHAALGWSRARWVVANNRRFLRKHRAFIDREFDIGDPRLYLARFAARVLAREVLVPGAVRAKRRLLAWPSTRRGAAPAAPLRAVGGARDSRRATERVDERENVG